MNGYLLKQVYAKLLFQLLIQTFRFFRYTCIFVILVLWNVVLFLPYLHFFRYQEHTLCH